MHILYSFIRCPWAMRARLALNYMGIQFSTREVDLRDKPQAMLEASPKGTVPVLILQDGKIIDESLDIILWAMPDQHPTKQQIIDNLIATNDTEFKKHNSRYKYPERYDEEGITQIDSRNQCEKFILKLESLLGENEYLIGATPSTADLAIFPFIRQFSKVDEQWFASVQYPQLKRWLDKIYTSNYYAKTMEKFPVWVD